MNDIDSVILAIAGSTVAIIVGYVLNGWRERDFERRKTNYHSKLAAFKEINEAIWGLGCAYVYLRMIFDMAKRPSGNEAPIGEMLTLASLARDLENPLGTKTSECLIERWNSIGTQTRPPGRSDEDEVGDWLAGAGMSLTVLYGRVLNHHFGVLAKASLDASLVAETELVEEAIGDLGSYLTKKLNETFLPLFTGVQEPVNEELLNLKTIQKELDPLFQNLQSAMHDELAETL